MNTRAKPAKAACMAIVAMAVSRTPFGVSCSQEQLDSCYKCVVSALQFWFVKLEAHCFKWCSAVVLFAWLCLWSHLSQNESSASAALFTTDAASLQNHDVG